MVRRGRARRLGLADRRGGARAPGSADASRARRRDPRLGEPDPRSWSTSGTPISSLAWTARAGPPADRDLDAQERAPARRDRGAARARRLPAGHDAEYGDMSSRSAAHRAAFSPPRFTDEVYAVVRETWPYRADLDCVAVAPDGSVASYTLAWLDEENRVGEFEPVAHMRRIVAGARPGGQPVRTAAPARRGGDGGTDWLPRRRRAPDAPQARRLGRLPADRPRRLVRPPDRLKRPCPEGPPRDRAVEDVWNVGRTSVGQTRVRLVSDAEGGRRQRSSPHVPARRPNSPFPGDPRRDRAVEDVWNVGQRFHHQFRSDSCLTPRVERRQQSSPACSSPRWTCSPSRRRRI